MSYISVENVTKEFNGAQILKGINLDVESGELVTLLGPSGCGKSTLLRIIAGLETPTSGKIHLNEKDVTNIPVNKRNLGMVFQQYSLFPNMSVFNNVAFGLKIKKVDKAVVAQEVEKMLALVQLGDKADAYPGELSGGQQQRVALARALIVKPSVLLLDEPLSALDAKIKISLRKMIQDLQRELKITTIFVTHDQEEALSISDRVFVMESGKIIQNGTPHEIYTNPTNKFVAGFIGTFNFLDSGFIKGQTAAGQVLIRPEHIEILPEEAADGNDVYQGKIKDCNFFGSITRISVSVGENVTVLVDVFNKCNFTFSIGQNIRIRIPQERLISIPK